MSLQVTLMDASDLPELLPFVFTDVAKEQIRYRLKAQGLNFAARCQGQLVACGGVQVFWAGVGESWFAGTRLLPVYPLALFKAVRHWLPETMRLLGLWRVECVVRHDFLEAHRFAQHLGFIAEGTKRQYGPDRADYVMYARVAAKGEADG